MSISILSDATGTPAIPIVSADMDASTIHAGTGANVLVPLDATCLKAGKQYWIVTEWNGGTMGQIVPTGAYAGDPQYWEKTWAGVWQSGTAASNSMYFVVTGSLGACTEGVIAFPAVTVQSVPAIWAMSGLFVVLIVDVVYFSIFFIVLYGIFWGITALARTIRYAISPKYHD
jgi:hypothetical protein